MDNYWTQLKRNRKRGGNLKNIKAVRKSTSQLMSHRSFRQRLPPLGDEAAEQYLREVGHQFEELRRRYEELERVNSQLKMINESQQVTQPQQAAQPQLASQPQQFPERRPPSVTEKPVDSVAVRNPYTKSTKMSSSGSLKKSNSLKKKVQDASEIDRALVVTESEPEYTNADGELSSEEEAAVRPSVRALLGYYVA